VRMQSVCIGPPARHHRSNGPRRAPKAAQRPLACAGGTLRPRAPARRQRGRVGALSVGTAPCGGAAPLELPKVQHNAYSSGTLHVCICMYVKPAVCMMYVFTQKYIHIHAFATNLYFVCIVCMYVCVCMCMYLQKHFKIYRHIQTIHTHTYNIFNTYNTCRYIQIHTIHAIQTIHTYTCNTGIYMQYIQYKHIHTIHSNTYNTYTYIQMYVCTCICLYLHVLLVLCRYVHE
jgi:hypothetical protein